MLTSRLVDLGVALLALVVVSACTGQVVETGPGATSGAGFTEVVITVPPTTTPPSTSSPPSSSSPTGSSPTTTADSSEALEFNVGDCVTWQQGQSEVTFQVVPCETEHLVEIAGGGDLSGAFGTEAPFPDLDALQQAVADACAPVVTSYLGHAPDDTVEPGVIPPTEVSWDAGDRTAWCTLGLPRENGERPPYTGRLRDRG